jgi:small conductance mechanosensitive channel
MNQYLQELGRLDIVFFRIAVPFIFKTAGAFALWFLSGFLIRGLKKILALTLEKRRVDPTLIEYSRSALGIALRALTTLLILNIFGLETTSFSAILAAAGVAIGVAWSGLLSNFAAGIFLILFRPFKLGDSISAGGVTGVVREIGLFATRIDSGENLRYFVGNNKLFTDNILNYSANPHRIALFRVQLAHAVDAPEALEKLSGVISGVPGVISQLEVASEIQEFTPSGTVVTVRAACHPSDYASVVAAGNLALARHLKAGSYPVPELRISALVSSTGRSES